MVGVHLRSVTELPLHGGKAPRWLFERMVRLCNAIGIVMLDEFGADELLKRLSDSNWFQALACAIGYDWHSSGTTTVTLGALKEALNGTGELYFAGGKGKAGIRTPEDIIAGVDALSIPGTGGEFTKCSRLAAKIDSAMVYDHIGIYHHSFLFTKTGKWAVIQQALDDANKKAIRFQWHSDTVSTKEAENEPHSSVISDMRKVTMDLTDSANRGVRDASLDVLGDYAHTMEKIRYPARHHILPHIDLGKRGIEMLKRAAEQDPEDYTELLLIRGIGRKTLRSLAVVSSLIYDKEIAYRDPVAYSYNLGGKDGIPFPVDKSTYDSVVEHMNLIIDGARLSSGEKYGALKRLSASVSRSTVA